MYDAKLLSGKHLNLTEKDMDNRGDEGFVLLNVQIVPWLCLPFGRIKYLAYVYVKFAQIVMWSMNKLGLSLLVWPYLIAFTRS